MRLQHRCFPVNLVESPFWQNTSRYLLLWYKITVFNFQYCFHWWYLILLWMPAWISSSQSLIFTNYRNIKNMIAQFPNLTVARIRYWNKYVNLWSLNASTLESFFNTRSLVFSYLQKFTLRSNSVPLSSAWGGIGQYLWS